MRHSSYGEMMSMTFISQSQARIAANRPRCHRSVAWAAFARRNVCAEVAVALREAEEDLP